MLKHVVIKATMYITDLLESIDRFTPIPYVETRENVQGSSNRQHLLLCFPLEKLILLSMTEH